MHQDCPGCGATTTVDTAFTATYYACWSCGRYYANENGRWALRKTFTYHPTHDMIKVGQSGVFNDVRYTITGIVIKRVYEQFYWNEYILQDAQGNFRYLSESEGHWILLEEIDMTIDMSRPRIHITHNGEVYDLFEDTMAQVKGAAGFFDFHVAAGGVAMVEYINPPYMLSFDSMQGHKTGYYGRHVSPAQVKKAFALDSIKSRQGIGMVQPKLADLRLMAMTFCVAIVLMFVTHVFIYSGQSSQEVLSTALVPDGTEFVSPSFELRGGSAPLTVVVRADVDNAWASVDVALVNEKTNEEVYASKDVEYYHGYEGGENWTEGSQEEEFNLCGVAAGKYHLTVTPGKDASDWSTRTIAVKAVWNEPSTRNVWFPALLMGGILVAFFYYDKNFETRRWADSDYSPYTE